MGFKIYRKVKRSFREKLNSLIIFGRNKKKNRAPEIKEVLLNDPASKVWKAITDKNEIKHWYFDLVEFKPEIGFEFQFSVEMDGKNWLHLCKIRDVIIEKKLSYSWRYDGYGGDSIVTFELSKEGTQTNLKLTHTGLETFAPEFPYTKEKFTEGWNQIIGNNLKKFVEKE